MTHSPFPAFQRKTCKINDLINLHYITTTWNVSNTLIKFYCDKFVLYTYVRSKIIMSDRVRVVPGFYRWILLKFIYCFCTRWTYFWGKKKKNYKWTRREREDDGEVALQHIPTVYSKARINLIKGVQMKNGSNKIITNFLLPCWMVWILAPLRE